MLPTTYDGIILPIRDLSSARLNYSSLVDSPKNARYNAVSLSGAWARKGLIMKKTRDWVAVVAICLGLAAVAGPGMSFAQDVLKKATAVPKLIGQADLDCSLFLLEAPPKIRITAPYVAGEKSLLTDSDLFYADPVPGVEAFLPDSLWSILEWGAAVKGGTPAVVLGNVAALRGRARVVRVESGRAVMRIEKSCGLIQAGSFLIPFQTGEILTGAEQEYRVPFRTEGAPTGRIVFQESDYTQLLARGHWAIIDLGEAQGLAIGQQLTVFHKEGKDTPVAVANAVIVWTGARWATIKILNSDTAVSLGDWVQPKANGGV